MVRSTVFVVIGWIALAFELSRGGFAAEAVPAVPRQSWTLDEALQQLRLYPHDVYLQYVAVQMARREDRMHEVPAHFDLFRDRRGANERVQGVDLFSIFSGALAVQESLQLDTLLGEQQGLPGAAPQSPPAWVKLTDLTGPTIKSHPWEAMLAGRKPELSPLARCVPADFYFVEFRSLGKLLDLGDHGDLWARHVFSQTQREARSQLTGERLKRQLALETTNLLRPFYDLVVEEVALTGSDLFWREGSDVTLLFRFRQADVFKAQMELFLQDAERAQPGAKRSNGECLGVPYVHLTSADRAVHVFSAYPEPNLHVRSNSRVALERLLAAIRGQDADGRPAPRLGDTTEFAYIRTLLPRGAAEEDGFAYLSDPFIRRLVGPQLKLTERRRMICYNHLRMIGHAALLYRTQQGQVPPDLSALTAAGCAPSDFGTGDLACPDGGRYTLAADGLSGVCSHHGRAECLTPCCEIPLAEVTAGEADAYRNFLEQYNQYWRTFFDPIALRIQVAPDRYRIETLVLPLIDNSIYTGLAEAAGNPPEPLDALPVPKRNIFSLALRLDKTALVRRFGWEEMLQDLGGDDSPAAQREIESVAQTLKQLALAWHNYHDTHRSFPTPANFQERRQSAGLSWRVHLLPYLEQMHLYNEFHLDEPWDSEHNQKLIARMPSIFRPANAKLAAEGKTKFVTPVGDKMLMPKDLRSVRMADVTDGTSNTIMLVEADDEHAVVWTKPEDFPVDLNQPLAGLAVRPPGAFLVALCDGSVAFFRTSMPQPQVMALFTRSGREVMPFEPERVALRLPGHRREVFGLEEADLRQLRAGEFLARGIGNQIGVHVCDADPLFAFSLPSFLGMSLATFQGGRGLLGGDEGLMIGLLIAALNSPVYVSVPVQDPQIVDAFLDRLDRVLAEVARQSNPGVPFFQIDQDYYHLPLGDTVARGYGFQVGPVKWRFFWARIGQGLYVASKPFILEDLAAQAGGAAPGDAADVAAHGLVRLRPQNWERVLPSYKLGWAENNREACLQNLGPLSSLARAFPPADAGQSAEQAHAELVALGERFFDAHFFCPDGGQYTRTAQGQHVTCSLHGSAALPRQPSAPSEQSGLGRVLQGLSDITLTLTFLEDGLHAVVTVPRPKAGP